MAKIVIIGAGVMGSALSVPASVNHNDVVLVGTPLDRDIINALKQNQRHPSLDEQLPNAIVPLQAEELNVNTLSEADAVIFGVSSAGVEWAIEHVSQQPLSLNLAVLVTKGLEPSAQVQPLTYADTFLQRLSRAGVSARSLIGIGGPCIARELVLKQPTTVVYASTDAVALARFAGYMQTPEYRVFQSSDIVGVEACAALKNFLAIGVSAMISRYQIQSGSAKNPTAAAFNQAVRELALMCEWIGGKRDTAFDQAGMGDLHVTVGGGRNSRLGGCLGQGMTLSAALQGPLSGLTVEGKDTGLVLAPALHGAIEASQLDAADFPLSLSILKAIETDQPFEFDFALLT